MTESGHSLDNAVVDFLLDSGGTDDPTLGGDAPGGDGQTVTMKGDLDQINLSDIFQTLAMTKMEGVLRVRNPLEQRQVYCRDGYVRILVPPRVAVRRLGQRLVSAGLVQPEHLRAALLRQRKDRRTLGELLIEDGLVTTEQIDELVGQQVGEDLFALFTWRHGTFELWKGAVADPELSAQFDSCPEFEVSSLLLEVARRSDEWDSILQAIGSLDEVPFRSAEPPADQELDETARTLLAGADGRTTYRALAETITLGLFEVARVARDLVRNGLLQNLPADQLVAIATAEAEAGHHKQALLLLQTLRDRPEPQPAEIVQGMVDALVQAGERRLAGNLLLEFAQQLEDPTAAVATARKARELAPHDPATLSYLRTVLLAHGTDPAELERCTLDLLDALLAADELGPAAAIVAELRDAGPVPLQALTREAKLLQKQRDPVGAARVLGELAARHAEAGDRQHTIETYEAILRLDHTRRDIQKLLRNLRQTRVGRIVRASAAVVAFGLLSATGWTWWQQARYEDALRNAGAELDDLLGKGERGAAREALERWTEVLGEGEAVDDLRQKLDFADGAERSRLLKLARQRVQGRLQQAATLLTDGDLRGALSIYGDLQRQPDFQDEVREVVATRLAALLTEIEQCGKTMHNRLPAAPSVELDRKALQTNQQDLERLCRPALQRLAATLTELAPGGLPNYLAAELRQRATAVLQAHGPTFLRAATLAAAYDEAVQRDSTERRLDPMFKRAVQLEAELDFAGALAIFRQLAAEPAGTPELHREFAQRIERNEVIVRGLERITAATAAGDAPAANTAFRRLQQDFPELPVAGMVKLPVRITTLPPGANVRLGEQDLGITPCVIALPPGHEAELLLAAAGFTAEAVRLRSEVTATVTLPLRRTPDQIFTLDSTVEAAPAATAEGDYAVVDRQGQVQALGNEPTGTRWRFRSGDLSGLLTAPLVHGPLVVFGSLDGDLRGVVTADGSRRWTIANLPTEVAPVLAGGRLFVATTTGELVAVDPLQGTELARSRLPAAPRSVHGLPSGLLLLLFTDGRLATYGSQDLQPHWQRTLPNHGDLAATLQGEVLVVGDDRGHLTRLEPQTGEPLWQAAFDAEPLGPPCVAGGEVWLATGSRVLRFDAANGKPGQGLSSDTEPWVGPVQRVGDRLLVPCRDGTVHVYDRRDGTPLYRLEGARRGVVIQPTSHGAFVALPDRRLLHFRTLP